MYIVSIKNDEITVLGQKFHIIEIKLYDKSSEVLNNFMLDIQDYYNMAWDDIDEELNVLTMTFDYIPKEQTMTIIKKYTENYIENMEAWRKFDNDVIRRRGNM